MKFIVASLSELSIIETIFSNDHVHLFIIILILFMQRVHAKIFFFGQYWPMLSIERPSFLMFVCEKTHSASRISFVQCGKLHSLQEIFSSGQNCLQLKMEKLESSLLQIYCILGKTKW